MSAGKKTPRHALAIVDARGIIRHSDGWFEALVRREWPSWHDRAIPPPLLNWLLTPTDPSFNGYAIHVDCQRIGDVFMLRARPLDAADALTPRERQIAERFSHGLTYKGVAQELALSPATVRNHIQSIYAKLGVHGKVQLARLLARTA